MSRYLGWVAVVLLSGLGWAQSAQSKEPAKAPAPGTAAASADAAAFSPIVVRFTLQADSVVTLDQFSGSVPSQTKCDPDGNVYGEFSTGSASALTRISADGSQPTSFPLSAVTDLGDPNSPPPALAEFAVGTDGSVYLLLRIKRQVSGDGPPSMEYRVVSFNSDGKYHSQFKLDEGLAPNRIAVFSSGDLMLAGSEPDPDDDDHRVPFAGVFDSGGRFMKEISMPRDLRSPEGGQNQSASGGGWARRDRFAVRGSAQGADDGNVYLLPNVAEAPVYVLSQGGEIVRTIKLESAADERLGMSVAAGRLLSWSQHVNSYRSRWVDSPGPVSASTVGQGDSLFRIFNLQTGELAAEYSASADLGTFACYGSDGFVFLRQDQARHLQVVTAGTR